MYKAGLVVTIKTDEGYKQESETGIVMLKDNTKYSIYMKNTTGDRYKATILVDGIDVLGGQSLVINANSSATLDRYMLDGNLTSGKSFLFVEATDSRVPDAKAPSNGKIEVKFYKERRAVQRTPSIFDQIVSPIGPPFWYYDTGYDGVFGNITRGASLGQPTTAKLSSCSASTRGTAGATVEGSESNQAFTYSKVFDTYPHPEQVFSFTLRCRAEPLVWKSSTQSVIASVGSACSGTTYRYEVAKEPKKEVEKRYCQHCGKEVEPGDTYCRHCGKKL